MAAILGKNVFIYQGASGTSSVLAGAKSCTVSLKCDLIEKASSSQQGAKEYLAGRKEWDVSLNHIIMSGSGINTTAGLLKVGNTYTLRLVVSGGQVFKGDAICTQYDITGSVGTLATGAVKFKGSGPFDPTT